MVLLALSRNLVAWRETLLAGAGSSQGSSACSTTRFATCTGATLGLIGSGTLGNGVARLAEAFGMRVLRAERRGGNGAPGYTAFADVLAEADAISLHCPLTPETTGLIGEAELRHEALGLLINTARGGIVDEAALIPRSGRLDRRSRLRCHHRRTAAGGASHGRSAPLALPNFLLTPHVAWSSRPAMQALADQLIDNIEAFAAGTPAESVA